MKCEDVRPTLAELAGDISEGQGAVWEHVAACPDCSAELARYRSLATGLEKLRAVVEEPPPGLLDLLLADASTPLPEESRGSGGLLHHAALSIGGAVVGATAVALVWWRLAARRSLRPAEPSSSV